MNVNIPYRAERESNEFTMYEAVHVIIEDISAKLIGYFDNKLKPSPDMNILLQNHLRSWLRENENTTLMDSYPRGRDITEPTLLNLIFCELSTVLSQCSEAEALSKYKEIKRGRKKYLYTQLREEAGELPIKPRNSYFMQNEWDAINSPYILNNMEQMTINFDFSVTGSFEDFKKYRFDTVTAWYKEKDGFLLDFPYFEMLSAARKLSIYLIDLTYNCLSIICKDYYRSKTGFVTRTLDTHLGLKDASLFSWQSNALELKYEITDGIFQIYESLELSPNNALKIIVYEEPYDPAMRNVNPDDFFEKVKSDMNKGQQYRTLDTFDVSILTAILNNFSVASLQDKSLQINLIDLAHDVYGDSSTLKARDCERLIRHIIKLGRTRISNVSTTDNGLLIGGGNITFYEYKFQVLTNSSMDNENILTTINMASGDTKIDYSKLSMKDYSSMEMVFYLSNYMYTLWNNSMHTYISSTLYRQIESSKGRALMQILQEERLRIYPELDTFMPMARFRSHLKIAAKAQRFKQELAAEMELLKSSGIAVSAYEVISNGVNITFHPLSTAEKTAYKL